MKRIFFSLCAAVLGCTLSLQFPAAADARSKEKVLYSFGNDPDAEVPYDGLIDVKGTLYGTTAYGGAHCKNGHVCGTVFAVDAKTGAETVLYSFCSQKNCADGDATQGGLIDVNGTLYGTTYLAGANAKCGLKGLPQFGCGTVFSLDPTTGAESVLYSFCAQKKCTDGAGPYVGLINVNGTLYGTTGGGGANCESHEFGGCGTVFSIDPTTGAETVLYSFCAQQNCSDGSEPSGGLIYAKGTLYGMTGSGGANYTECFGYGCGTVFALDPMTHAETVLYSFCSAKTQRNCTDGSGPAGLIDVNGTLYGTTSGGGSNANKNWCIYSCGTVFSLDPGTGVETVLYAFCSQQNMDPHAHCTDGDDPYADPIDVKGTLYGTTWSGGAHEGGVLFSLDPNTGAETVVHAFGRGTDGRGPEGSLIDVTGTFYGTTTGGGTGTGCTEGCGTVFALRP